MNTKGTALPSERRKFSGSPTIVRTLRSKPAT